MGQSVAMFSYTSGNSSGNVHFLIKVPNKNSSEEKLQEIVEEIKVSLPVYHTRQMRKDFILQSAKKETQQMDFDIAFWILE